MVMRFVDCILWGLAVACLISAAFKASMIWVAAPLLGLALSYSLLYVCLYRPPEDHLGVIYRFSRFSRLVGPEQWVFIIPGLHEIKDPISLHVRWLEANLSDMLTQDQVPIDCKLTVYYQRDLRHADAHFRSQALHIPDKGWDSIIRTVLQETANEVTSVITFRQLLTLKERHHFKWRLTALLAERVRRLGLVINPKTGISVQVLKPADAIWRAMVDRSAAVSLGEAALARVHPILEDLSQRHPGVAWETLLLEWAAAVAKEGTTPQVLVAPAGEPARAV
jgi:regulator of protease activity HflC (stomatin/prohibitin superfamily)